MSETIKNNIKSKDGVNLYYEFSKVKTNYPPIFLVHGVGGDLDAWQYIKDKLVRKGFSVITMDLRGHGKSGHPYSFKKYELHNFIDDAILVLDTEKIDKVILVGHSLGAVLATHMILERPERFEKLILLSGSHVPPPYFNIPGMFGVFNTLAFISLPPIYPGHSIYPKGKIHKDIENFGLVRTILRNSLRSYLLSSKEILKTDLSLSLPQIKVPTLLVSGEKDSIFPLSNPKYIHSQIPNSRLEIIPGANHVFVHNNIGETVNYISDFIEEKK